MFFLAVLLVFVIAWLAAELRAGVGARISLGMVCMVVVASGWLFAEQRRAQLEALHQACFRKMGSALESGETEKVKQAISIYNTSAGDPARVFQALDVMNKKVN